MLPPLIERKALDEVLKLFGPGLPVEDEASLPPEPFIPSSVTVKDNKATLTIEFSAKTALNKRDEQDESDE